MNTCQKQTWRWKMVFLLVCVYWGNWCTYCSATLTEVLELAIYSRVLDQIPRCLLSSFVIWNMETPPQSKIMIFGVPCNFHMFCNITFLVVWPSFFHCMDKNKSSWPIVQLLLRYHQTRSFHNPVSQKPQTPQQPFTDQNFSKTWRTPKIWSRWHSLRNCL